MKSIVNYFVYSEYGHINIIALLVTIGLMVIYSRIEDKSLSKTAQISNLRLTLFGYISIYFLIVVYVFYKEYNELKSAWFFQLPIKHGDFEIYCYEIESIMYPFLFISVFLIALNLAFYTTVAIREKKQKN